MAVRMRPRDIKPTKLRLAAKQGFKCALCLIDLKTLPEKDWVLDHDHSTGAVRSVLCRNCNGMEGKVYNRANQAKRGNTALFWLIRLVKYYEYHNKNQTGLLHPTHKTDDEKRIERNRKAREARAKQKALDNIKKKGE